MKKLILAVAAVAAGVVNAVAEPTVLPASMYVQDGLVLMIDGIENAGPGQHDPAVTQLVDLSGGGAVSDLIAGEEVREKSFLLKTVHNFAGAFARLGGMPKDSLTLEVVSHPWPKNGSSWTYANDAGVLRAANFGSIGYDTRASGGMTLYLKKSWSTASQDKYYYYLSSSPHGVIANHIKASAAPLCSSWSFKADKAAPYVENALKSYTSFWNGGACGYSDTIDVANDKEYTEIYSVRVYNRELTDGEREANYLIDRNRFFGEPIPSDKRMVVSIPDQKFDGIHPVTPVPKVTDLLTGKVLEEGVDYEYVAEGTGALGTGTCTVTGKGAYAGNESVTPFKVVSAYGTGKILYVVPDADDSADEDCSDFAHGGTLANACSRLTDGTVAAPTVIVLKSGTAENPAVYDYSKIVKGDGQHTLAIVGKNYVTIRSMDLNPTNCIVRGGGQAQDLRCLQVTANSRVEGITFEGFGKTGHSTGGEGMSLGFGAAIWAARGTAIANCIFRANFGTDVGAVYYGDVTACAFICNTNEQASGYHVGAGALFTRGTVRDSYFFGNCSGVDSGALSFYNADVQKADNCLFVSNSGSFAVSTYSAKTTIATNCVFYRNQCCSMWNGMALDCEFRENRTPKGNSGWPTSAGGVYNTTANDCLFVSNETYSATVMAAAHALGATCTRCTFIGGAALAPEGQTAKGYPCTASSTLIDCTIRDTTFTKSPHYRPARMVGTKFLNCTYTAAVITEISDGTMKNTVISNCVFVGNTTAGTLLNAPNTAPFVNCLIVSNRSTRSTAGNLIASGTFCNCTIAENVCGTWGNPAVAAACVCSNTVIYGNSGYDLEGSAGNLRYCAWGTAHNGAAPSDESNRQLTRSPFDMTVDAKHPWGFQPRRGTTGLVDKGFSDATYEAEHPTDLAGNPRVFGKAIDVGCYEWQGPYPGLLLMVR